MQAIVFFEQKTSQGSIGLQGNPAEENHLYAVFQIFIA